MKTRILTAVVALCVFIPILIFSYTVVWQIAMAALSVIAVWEMLTALGQRARLVCAIPALVLAGAFPVLSYVFTFEDARLLILSFFGALLAWMFILFTYAVLRGGDVKFSEIAEVLVSVAYVVGGFSALSMLRLAPMGAYLYLTPFIGAWLTDTMAYFTGFFLGKHKLCPTLSPKKTIEGAIGGTIGGALAVVLFGAIVGAIGKITPNYPALAVCGLVTALLSQVGDLIASLIKREKGIKDYGRVFPGHGGVMDRFDSVIAVAVLPFVASLLPAWAQLFS